MTVIKTNINKANISLKAPTYKAQSNTNINLSNFVETVTTSILELNDKGHQKEKYNKLLTDDYKCYSNFETKKGNIVVGSKEGENSRIYLFNTDDSLQGIIALDDNDSISGVTFEEESNKIIVMTENEVKEYNTDRIARSIELANKYEGNNIGKYYATDGEKVVEVATNQLGKDYVYSACGPDAFDCSGLVSYCLTGKYERIGSTSDIISWPETTNPQPGDICIKEGHTGIYIGNGQMIHAATEGVGVVIGDVQDGMWYVTNPGY